MISVSLQNFFSTHYTTKQQVYSWKPERELEWVRRWLMILFWHIFQSFGQIQRCWGKRKLENWTSQVAIVPIGIPTHSCVTAMSFDLFLSGQLSYIGILLPKLFWPTMKKNVLVIENNFEIRGWRPRICKNFWDH